MKHLAADWTKSRVVGGREAGGRRPFRWFSQWSNHKQSSECAVQTGGYPPGQASLFLPFLSYICHFYALAVVCFLVVVVVVGGGGDLCWLCSVWVRVVCVGACVSTAVTHKPFWLSSFRLWEKCLLYFSPPMQIWQCFLIRVYYLRCASIVCVACRDMQISP